jgi:regulator of replication initiation timing
VDTVRAAANDVRAQERKVIELDTKLGERTSDISEVKGTAAAIVQENARITLKHQDIEREVGELRASRTDLERRIGEAERLAEDLKKQCKVIQEEQAGIRLILKDTKAITEALEAEQKTLTRVVTELNARSVIALGGGGAAGGGIVAAIFELIQRLT